MAVTIILSGLFLGALATWAHRSIPKWLLADASSDEQERRGHISSRLRAATIIILSLGLAYACFLTFGATWKTVAASAFAATLLALAAIDLDHRLLPDMLTQPLLWAGLLLNAHGLFTGPTNAIYGAAAGYLCLWGPFHVYRALTGRDGMGYGDFKLVAAVGAWLGAEALPQVLIGAIGSAAVVGLCRAAARRTWPLEALPFGPYIAAAALMALFFALRL